MADAEEVFSAEGIRNFIISRGGRVKNVELVGHYKKYLNDPVKKAENRQKFKDFINAVAVVKVENDAQKTLVLKKKQQDWSSPKGPGSQDSLPRQRPFQAPPPPPQSSPRRTPSPKPRTRPPTTPPPPPPSDGTPPVNRPVPKPRQSKAKSSPASRPEISAPMLLQRPEPVPESAHQPGVEPMQTEPVYAELMKMGPERSRTPPPSNGVIRNGGGDPAAGGDGEYTYTGPKEQTSYVSPKEGERIIDAKSQISSVRDQASFFQEAAAQQAQELEAMQSPVRTPRKQRISLEDNDAGGTLKGDEELYATLALDPLEREWMVYASQGNVGGMCNLLTQDHTLCSKKDFITGFTALHWGAKLGKKEMIKLVADKGVDINMRSQGGYTALHIAALHHKEAVMQLLIQDYYANVDIRDYSGKKPKHYLKKGASAFIKQLLQGKSSAALEHLLTNQQRIIHEVVKTRHKSKIGKISASFRHSFRHSFFGGSVDSLDGDDDDDVSPCVSPRLSPRSSPMSSPRMGMKHSRSNEELLMPPPKTRPPKHKSARPKSTGPISFNSNSGTKSRRRRSNSLQFELTLGGITEG